MQFVISTFYTFCAFSVKVLDQTNRAKIVFITINGINDLIRDS